MRFNDRTESDRITMNHVLIQITTALKLKDVDFVVNECHHCTHKQNDNGRNHDNVYFDSSLFRERWLAELGSTLVQNRTCREKTTVCRFDQLNIKNRIINKLSEHGTDCDQSIKNTNRGRTNGSHKADRQLRPQKRHCTRVFKNR